MYYFDNKNEPPVSSQPPINNNTNDNDNNNNNNNNNNSNPLFSQSFDPSTLHQPHSLDNNYSFYNFGNDAHNSLPPSAFLQEGSSSSLGHDSLLAQGWEGMYDSNFTDNSSYDHQSSMMYLSGHDQHQHQQHQSHQPFDQHDNSYNKHHHQLQSLPPPTQGKSDFFLSLTEQEQQAILMSEPNFLRQQQFLHDKEIKMKMEENEDQQQQNYGHGDAGTPMRSNLSAMFDQSTPPQATMDMLSSSIPSTHTNTEISQQQIYGHQSMQHTISFDEDQYQHRQQQHQPPPPQQSQQHQSYSSTPTITTTKTIASTTTTTGKATPSGTIKSRKETNRRSQQGSGARGNNRPNPIPISGGGNIGSGSKNSSSVPSEIDHQRRFNELQARFRVNYARKPTTNNTSSSTSSTTPSSQQPSQQNHPIQQQQQQQVSINASSPSITNSAKSLSSSFSGTTNGFGNQTSHDGKEVSNNRAPLRTPTEKTQGESALGNTNNDNKTERSNDKSSAGTGISMTDKGTATQKTDNNNTTGSSSGGGKQASSFPSRTMPIQIQRVHRANSNQPMDAEQHQKRLDDQLVKANFDDITVSELKEMLRQRGKPATGKKAILLQRLVEEREVIKAVRGGKITHRHSQPLPPTTPTLSANPSSLDSNTNAGTSTRPRSYQGSSPMFAHTNLPPNSPLLESPSSVPNSSMYLSSSPGSVTLSLNRSIANMHIGSPPMSSQHVRRFSPYGTPGSPRLGSASSPKMQRQSYSSSVPNDYLSSSPNGGGGMVLPPSFGNFVGNDGYNNNTTSPMTPGPPNSTRNMRLYHQNQNWNGRQKSYAPFTSSALATPDRDDDDDPFDVMAREQDNVDMDNGQQHENQVPSQPLYDSLYELQQQQQQQLQQSEQYHHNNGMDTDGVKEEPMEWINNNPSTYDPSLNGLLQELPEGVSMDQFMAWFSTMNAGANELGQFNLSMDAIKTENNNSSDMMSMDMNHINHYSGSPAFNRHHHHQNGDTDNTA